MKTADGIMLILTYAAETRPDTSGTDQTMELRQTTEKNMGEN
jgi:hypothetical protein